MTIARHGLYVPADAGFELIAFNAWDFNTAVAEWAQTNVAFTSDCNYALLIATWEANVTLNAAVVRDAGDTTTLATLTSLTSVSGASSQSNCHAYHLFNASSLGLSLSDARVELTFSAANAAGSLALWRFRGATRQPTTGDHNTQGGASLTSLTGSLTPSAGAEEAGIICASLCTNDTITSVVCGGGLLEPELHKNTGAAGGMTNVFSHNLGPLSGAQSPSFDWTAHGAERASGLFVLAA